MLHTCDYVLEGKEVRSMQTDTDAVINMAVKCTTSQVIYCITCKKQRYREQYCEKTVWECRSRIHQHRVSVTGTDGKQDRAQD